MNEKWEEMSARTKTIRENKPLVPEVVDGGTYADLVGAIGSLLERARAALVEHMKNFMLELGKGFAFVASEYRIPPLIRDGEVDLGK